MVRGLTICTLYQKLFSDQTEDRTGEIWGMCGGEEKRILGFSRENRRKDTALKT